MHVRCYSSKANGPPTGNGESDDSNRNEPDLASSLGFQSLSGLFQQPFRRRYSQPREAEQGPGAEQAEPKATQEVKPGIKVDGSLFQPSKEVMYAPASAIHETNTSQFSSRLVPTPMDIEPASEGNSSSRQTSRVPEAHRTSAGNASSGRHSRLIRTYEASFPKANFQHLIRTQALRVRARRRPNPFAVTSEPSNKRLATDREQRKDGQRPWGLSKQDMDTVDSITDPSTATAQKESSGSKATRKEASTKTAKASSKLTHVTPTGEAHMVDVGAKQASRRVAIAFAYVRFSNPEPFRLIFENSNKKGDVLGVARIAGIMAAKRTSDLVPLCHPLAITKLEVDVKLEAPGTSSKLWANNKFGVVTLQAQVSCVGPTGVEMEALTAASVAALTVYDMCKAVDRGMSIVNCQVVYKSGGKSGLHSTFHWASCVKKAFFVERGLEIPDYQSSKENGDVAQGNEE